jgi:O-antigen/teichoic acid export membrane protein
LVNWIKAPVNILVFVIPAVCVPFGLRLRGIVLLIAVARLVASLFSLVFCYRAFPFLKDSLGRDTRLIKSLLSFGGWVTVSNVVGPMVTYLDRFLVGSILSMTALAYYTAPYELVARVWILPWSLVSTLFPAFSVLSAHGANLELERIYSRSIKVLLLVVGPIVLLIILLAPGLLRVWLGSDFALNSTTVLKVLAVGVLVVSIANVPFTALQSLGRPDVPAKFHLIELPIYAGLAQWSITRIGILGAAIAWCATMTLDALLLFGAAWRLFGLSPRVLASNGVVRAVTVLAVPGIIVLIPNVVIPSGNLLVHLVIAGAMVMVYAVLVWLYALDAADRDVAKAIGVRLANGFVRAR